MNKKTAACLAGSLILTGCKTNPDAGKEDHASHYLLIGSYCEPAAEGIQVYSFDQENGSFAYVSGLKGISNPSYLQPSADGSFVYAVSEDEGETSAANALRFDKAGGLLTFLNQQPTYGGAPCYIAVDPDNKIVVTANYLGGSITAFSVYHDGSLMETPELYPFEEAGPDMDRQGSPHLHCVVFSPDGKYLLATDLGSDRIHGFDVVKTEKQTKILEDFVGYDCRLEPGDGPRHLTFHPDGKHAYLISELSGMVTAFTYSEGVLTPFQTILADDKQARGSADIHITPDGRFLYASNRLQGDGIAIFSIREDRTLERAGYQETGIHPRNFIITPNGKYLLVACRDSNMVQLFEINKESGLLSDTGKTIAMSRPVCLKFIEK